MHGSVLGMVHGVLHGVVMRWGWDNCMCFLPGFVLLDLGVGAGLVCDGEEVFGVVSSHLTHTEKNYTILLLVIV